jgi:hypothetical protein
LEQEETVCSSDEKVKSFLEMRKHVVWYWKKAPMITAADRSGESIDGKCFWGVGWSGRKELLEFYLDRMDCTEK